MRFQAAFIVWIFGVLIAPANAFAHNCQSGWEAARAEAERAHDVQRVKFLDAMLPIPVYDRDNELLCGAKLYEDIDKSDIPIWVVMKRPDGGFVPDNFLSGTHPMQGKLIFTISNADKEKLASLYRSGASVQIIRERTAEYEKNGGWVTAGFIISERSQGMNDYGNILRNRSRLLQRPDVGLLRFVRNSNIFPDAIGTWSKELYLDKELMKKEQDGCLKRGSC